MTKLINPENLYITANASSVLNARDVMSAIERFNEKDWGELGEEDKQLNDEALEHGGRILAAYSDKKGVKFWIIREADEKTTTVLLPEDY